MREYNKFLSPVYMGYHFKVKNTAITDVHTRKAETEERPLLLRGVAKRNCAQKHAHQLVCVHCTTGCVPMRMCYVLRLLKFVCITEKNRNDIANLTPYRISPAV